MPTEASAVSPAGSPVASITQPVTDKLRLAYEGGSRYVGADPLSDLDPSKGAVHTASNAGTVIGILILGVVAIIGIFIFANIDDAIELESEHALEGPMEDLTSFFGESMSMIGIAMIVAVAAVIVGYVQTMRNGGGAGLGR